MKAILLTGPGDLDSLHPGEIDAPEPGPGEIRVRVHAASLNPVDCKSALSRPENRSYPHILGVDVAGVVDAVGAQAGPWAEGDRVFYHTSPRRHGGFAEFHVTPAHTVSRLPAEVSFTDAAALPCSGLTAYQALFRRLNCERGESLLVHAAAGGVGSFAVQLGRVAGLRVIATCSRANADYVRGLGADEIIDYRTEDVAARVRELTAAQGGVDAILDTLGPRSGVDNLSLLTAEGGAAFVVGLPDLSGVADMPVSISVHDIGLGGALDSPAFRRQQEDLARMGDELMALVVAGKVQATVSEIIDWRDIPAGLKRLHEGHSRGKIVARML